MKIKYAKVLRSVSKIALLLCILSFLGLGIFFTYKSLKYKPYKVRVSNVTDSAFTVSWVTDEPMVGVVYYGEKDSFLPGPLAWIGQSKAVDDRDMSNAQTECVSDFNKKASKTKDANFTVSIEGYDCNDVKVVKRGEYYTHHVTVQNLEAEKEYYFKVGDGYISYAKGKTEGVEYIEREMPAIEVFSQKTLPVITEIQAPNPAYGTSYNIFYRDDGTMGERKNFDSIIFLLTYKDGNTYPLLSSVSNSDGGWSIDLSNVRNEENEPIPMDGVSLEFIPQVENTKPGASGYTLYENTTFPLRLMGNSEDDWGEDKSEEINLGRLLKELVDKSFAAPITSVTCYDGCTAVVVRNNTCQEMGYESTMPSSCNAALITCYYCDGGTLRTARLNSCTGKYSPTKQNCSPQNTPPEQEEEEYVTGCATPKSKLTASAPVRGACSGGWNKCYIQWFVNGSGQLCINQPVDGALCGHVACGDTKERKALTKEGEQCDNGYGCTCTISNTSVAAGKNINFRESCTSKDGQKFSGSPCVDKDGCVNPPSSATNPPSTTDSLETCYCIIEKNCKDSVKKQSCLQKEGCFNSTSLCEKAVNALEDETSSNRSVVQPTVQGASCEDSSNGCICRDGTNSSYRFGKSGEPEKCFTSLTITHGTSCPEEKPCKCSYTDSSGGTKTKDITPTSKTRDCNNEAKAETGDETGDYCWESINTQPSSWTDTYYYYCQISTRIASLNGCSKDKGFYNTRNECQTDIYTKYGGNSYFSCLHQSGKDCNYLRDKDDCFVDGSEGTVLKAGRFLSETECKKSIINSSDTKVEGEQCWKNKCVCRDGEDNLSNISEGQCCGASWYFTREIAGEMAPRGECRNKTPDGTMLVYSGPFCSEKACKERRFSIIANLVCEDRGGECTSEKVLDGDSSLVCARKNDQECKYWDYHKYNNSPDDKFALCEIEDGLCGEESAYLPDYKKNGQKYILESYADSSSDLQHDTDLLYFPEAGIYKITTKEGGKAFIQGGNEDLHFLYYDRDGIQGYQSPDDPGNPKDNEDLLVPQSAVVVDVSKIMDTYELTIKEGINIVSFDFMPTVDGIDGINLGNFLKLVNNNGKNIISRISYFNAGAWAGGVSYDFSTGETRGYGDNLLTFGTGYLLVATRDGTISIPGKKVESPVPIAFSSGWNLVGVHGYDTQYTANSLINSINTIEGLKSNNVTYWPTSKGMYEGYQLSEGQEYGQDYPISKDLGYFVRISEFNAPNDTCKSIIWNPGGDLNGQCGSN